MKKLLILTALLIAIIPGLTFGQAGGIGLYTDPVYTNCNFNDLGPALQPVYVVHKMTPGASAASFRVTPSAGFNMQYLGEVSPFAFVVGNSQTGVCVAYQGCFASDILILTINYFAQGLSEPCSRLDVVPFPGFDHIEVLDCADNVLAAVAGALVFNADGMCPCYVSAGTGGQSESKALRQGLDFCASVPVDRGSWGQIKALYR